MLAQGQAAAFVAPNGQVYYMMPGQAEMTAIASGPQMALMAPAHIQPAQMPATRTLQQPPAGQQQNPQQQGLVADLCKIIERQSQEIALLVQNRTTSDPNPPSTPPIPENDAEGYTAPYAHERQGEFVNDVDAVRGRPSRADFPPPPPPRSHHPAPPLRAPHLRTLLLVLWPLAPPPFPCRAH